MGVPVQVGGTINLNVGWFPPAGGQYFPHIVGTASGHIFAAWQSVNGYEGGFFGSYGLISTFAAPSGGTQSIDVASLGGGRVGVAWIDQAGDVNLQTLAVSGMRSAVITQATAGQQDSVAIASSRGYVVVVNSSPGAGEGDIYRSAYDSFGNLRFSPDEVTGGVRVAGVQDNPDIAVLANGLQIAVWIDRSDNTIRGSRLDEGARFGEALLLANSVPAASGQDHEVSVTGLASGGFAIAYRAGSGVDGVLQYRIFDQVGQPVTGLLTPAQLGGSDFSPQILGLPDGRFVIVTASNDNIVGQMFNADGTANSNAFTIESNGYVQNQPFLAMLADGRFAVSYSSNGVADGNARDLVMKIFDPRERGIELAGTSDNDDYVGSTFVDTIITGDGDDTVSGGGGADLLKGDAGSDTLRGDAGADRLYGGTGNDALFGGSDNDQLYGGWGADALNGGDGTIDYARYDDAAYGDIRVSLASAAVGTGAAKGDTFTGIEGIITYYGNDYVYGDGGNNYIYTQDGNDNLFGSNGADYLDGGNGLDYARFDDAGYGGLTADLANIVAGTGAAAGDTYVNIEGLILTKNSDYGYGTAGDNYLYGLGGNDTLDGRGGSDYLDGGIGNDSLTGGAGNDIYRYGGAGYGRDTIYGFEGGTGAGDRINLQGAGFANYSAAMASAIQVGNNVEIRINPDDVIVITNFLKGNLAADDFIF